MNGPETDPFTQVYEKLWDIMDAHKAMDALVAAGNRVKFTGDNRQPEKPNPTTADLPEMRLVQVEMEPHTERTSNGSSIVMDYGWVLACGDRRLDVALNPITFEIMRAMRQVRTQLTGLTWKSQAFVRNAQNIAAEIGYNTDEKLLRGMSGWMLAWRVKVEMWFSTASLAP